MKDVVILEFGWPYLDTETGVTWLSCGDGEYLALDLLLLKWYNGEESEEDIDVLEAYCLWVEENRTKQDV